MSDTTASSTPHIVFTTPESPEEISHARNLMREYINYVNTALGVDLDIENFQNIEGELQELPGKYCTAQGGAWLVATVNGELAGCVAMRALPHEAYPNACEMKRLYVRPEARGTQLGRRLAERICDEARTAGYARICLDTLSTLHAARRLYESLGFEPVEPYVFNPLPDAMFLGRRL